MYRGTRSTGTSSRTRSALVYQALSKKVNFVVAETSQQFSDREGRIVQRGTSPGNPEVMAMTDLASVRIIVYGRVQGVYFRAFTSEYAAALGLTGYVRNLPAEKAVEVQAEGERNKLEKLIEYLNVGPPGDRVESMETNWSEYTGSYSTFSIRY